MAKFTPCRLSLLQSLPELVLSTSTNYIKAYEVKVLCEAEQPRSTSFPRPGTVAMKLMGVATQTHTHTSRTQVPRQAHKENEARQAQLLLPEKNVEVVMFILALQIAKNSHALLACHTYA
ncbi:hypothetical protein PoB_006405500 [Plakobranchus ocellatus]|uniref:Uncharacterized protein n=1 Tax=Plakobranchus ocellatus TaxID=259542 RepID=A0AAV4D0F8_9GAST|nr:hypothetical protein PoB_006405500 [Plakobranchus ocellatus]